MANLETQLHQVQTSLASLNSRYTELRQKRYSKASSKANMKQSAPKVHICSKSRNGQEDAMTPPASDVLCSHSEPTTRRWEKRSETLSTNEIPSTEGTLKGETGDREVWPVNLAPPSSELVDRLVEEQMRLLNHDLLHVLKHS